jgi:hypothetical protein
MYKEYRDTDKIEKKVFDAAYNGWNMSGVYEVMFNGHSRTFRADSRRWLARDIKSWFDLHLEHHKNGSIVVRMLEAA